MHRIPDLVRSTARAFRGVALLAASIACERSEPPAKPEAPAPVTSSTPVAPRFVGATECAECHAAESEHWRTSHHARAMQPADASTVLGDFENASLSHFGVTSRFSQREGSFVVTTEGADGAIADHEVAYTFGVDPLQQYLVAFPRGRFQATSVFWDSRPREQGGQRWLDLHPDERITPTDPLHWTGPAGNWNVQCAECHSTDLRKGWNTTEERYETSWAEVSVSCEACHGPGSAHVAWARARVPGSDVTSSDPGLSGVPRVDRDVKWVFDEGAPIARRSAPRSSQRELDACGRCHSRRSAITERYEHGRSLLDTHIPSLLDRDLYFDDGQIRDEVYEWGSFLQSRMYAAGVSCSDCHEPHGLALRAEGNAVCARCHEPNVFDVPSHHHHAPGSPAARCIACHMPTRLYMVVDARHDHSLRVPRPDLTTSLGTPNACSGCHAKHDARWAESAISHWRGSRPAPRPHFGEVLAAARQGRVDAETRLAGLVKDGNQPMIARATALQELAGWWSAGSLATFEQTAVDPDPLLRLATAQTLDALDPPTRLRVGRPLLRDPVRAVRIEAARALASVPAQVWGGAARNELIDPLGEWRAAQAASGDRPEAHVALGALHAQLGERAEARREYETALRLGAFFVPTYVNLADLERQEGNDEAAQPLLARALALAPDSAETHEAMGLLQVRRQRLAEAIDELRRAAELAPDVARYSYVHAVALHSAGRSAEALEVLDVAHRRRPGERELLTGIATIAAETGDLERARAATRALLVLAPDDANARALAAQLDPASAP